MIKINPEGVAFLPNFQSCFGSPVLQMCQIGSHLKIFILTLSFAWDALFQVFAWLGSSLVQVSAQVLSLTILPKILLQPSTGHSLNPVSASFSSQHLLLLEITYVYVFSFSLPLECKLGEDRDFVSYSTVFLVKRGAQKMLCLIFICFFIYLAALSLSWCTQDVSAVVCELLVAACGI